MTTPAFPQPLPPVIDGLPANWAALAHPARVSDALLGGGDSYPADEALARLLTLAAPWTGTAARINRAHGALTTAYLARQGISQFLDLGCGYPTPPGRDGRPRTPDTHEAAACGVRGVNPVVVYVDGHPVVAAHARARHTGPPASIHVVHGDIATGLDQILTAPELDAFDLTQPIAVLLHDVLPCIPDDQTVDRTLTTLRHWLPAGSALSLTHATADLRPQESAAVTEQYASAGIAYRPRDETAVRALLGDWTQLGPGVVPTGHWHPDHPQAQEPPHVSAAYAGVARR
ncbi:SAM-dependent methyltransferase [Streptomyces sp. NPDC004726]